LYFETGEGPRFKKVIENQADVLQLPVPDPEQELRYVMDAVRTIRRELKGEVPLIGFSGSPWTLATYRVEGGSSKTFSKIKKMAYCEPETLYMLLDKLADSVILYLNAQIAAGAQAVMIFDTWGGVLTPRDYKKFSLSFMDKIVKNLTRVYEGQKIPVTLFTKNGGMWLEDIAATGCDAVGLDWTIDIANARARVGDKVALQGNMDPAILHSDPDHIRQEVQVILDGYGQGSGHVFNLGHGITPDVSPENAGAFIDAVHELSTPYHLFD
jgi:uroporphyrinogen decarboxylase